MTTKEQPVTDESWPTATRGQYVKTGQPVTDPLDDVRWREGYEFGLAQGRAEGLDVERLVGAMFDSYTYEDRDNAVPSLPFVDDHEGFWRPFAAKVRAALAETPVEAGPCGVCGLPLDRHHGYAPTPPTEEPKA